jgi:phage tail-like protein
VVSNDRKVWVADAANGYLHCFNFGGCWLKAIKGAGAVQALAVDTENRLYAAVSEALPVIIYDPATGEPIGELNDSESFCHAFPDPGIETDASGAFNLGRLCAYYQDSCAIQATAHWFDQTGKPVAPPSQPEQKYQTSGIYMSTAIDSHLYRCQWDRITLRARVSKGTRIKVSTFSAESALTARQIENLPEQQWQTGQWLYPGKNVWQSWDCLIRSEPGRLLWLKIEMTGDGTTTPAITDLQLDFPRISLRRYLPAVFGEEAQAADFTDRFLAVFDRGLRQIETEIDFMAQLFDPLSAPADAGKQDFLSWLASWIGVTLDRQLPLTIRRNLVKNAARLYQCRGTLRGLREMLDLYLGFNQRQCKTHADCGPCTTRPGYQWQAPGIILEHYKLRRWLFLDAGRLGDQARLWGQKIVNRSQLNGPQIDGNAQLGVTQLNTRQDPLRDPFHVYAHKFTVFLPAWVGRLSGYNKSIARIIQAEKPAHTAHRIVYVEPRFRVGIQSMIGFDAVIGCYPQGVTLGEAALGKATVLSNQDYAPTVMRIGNRSTIGSTAILQ